jgi:hypothetical protein
VGVGVILGRDPSWAMRVTVVISKRGYECILQPEKQRDNRSVFLAVQELRPKWAI